MVDIDNLMLQVQKLCDWVDYKNPSSRNHQRITWYYSHHDVSDRSPLFFGLHTIGNMYSHYKKMRSAKESGEPDPIFSIDNKRIAFYKIKEINEMLNPEGFKKNGLFYTIKSVDNYPLILLGKIADCSNGPDCPEIIIDGSCVSNMPVQLTASYISESANRKISGYSDEDGIAHIFANKRHIEICLWTLIHGIRGNQLDNFQKQCAYQGFKAFDIDARKNKTTKEDIERVAELFLRYSTIPHERGHYYTEQAFFSQNPREKMINDLYCNENIVKTTTWRSTIDPELTQTEKHIIKPVDIIRDLNEVLADTHEKGRFVHLFNTNELTEKERFGIYALALSFIFTPNDCKEWLIPELVLQFNEYAEKGEQQLASLKQAVVDANNNNKQHISEIIKNYDKKGHISIDDMLNELNKIYDEARKLASKYPLPEDSELKLFYDK